MDAASEMKLQIFSNQYYEFVDRFVQSDFENSKVLGKFYTDITIAKRMMSDLLQNYVFPENKDMIRIIDPFCGDGRLIKILLLQLIEIDRYDSTPLDVVLWDVDGEVVKKAKQGIEKLADEIGLRCTVTTRNADAYVLYSSEKSQFDICVTNPPWGLLKPQKVFNERCSQEEVNEYKNSIALYDDYMKTEFPLSQPTKKFGKWGTNLGRIGTEVALRLISNDGICGLVSPASLFNDQVSVPLREWLFDKHKIYSIFYYPAELKLYGSADVSSVTTVIGKGQTDTSLLTKMYNVDGSYQIRQLTDFQLDFVRRNQYALPLESGFDAFEILCHLGELPSVIECCDSAGFHFVRELDETRVSEKLKSKGEIIFAKGYMVDRYSFLEDGLFLDDEKVTPPETVM